MYNRTIRAVSSIVIVVVVVMSPLPCANASSEGDAGPAAEYN